VVLLFIQSSSRYASLLAMLLLAGCATIPSDRGLADVQAQLHKRGAAQLPALDDADNALLIEELINRAPLSVDDAVRIALLANPLLRSEYARLGLSSAEVYNAGRLSNPTVSAAILFGGEGNKTAFGLAQNFTDLLLLPARSRLANAEFERAKLQMGSTLINFSATVETAYFRAVGAEQAARMRTAIATAAATSATLAQRFFDAGNINRLELELNRAEAEQAQLDALAAQSELDTARAELNRRMGLTAARGRWHIATQLPEPVAQEDDLATLQALAESRLDLAAARRDSALLEDAYGVARNTRLLGESQIGIDSERETDGARLAGPTLAVQLPLFQQGQGNKLRANAQLELSRATLQTLQIDISNDVQLAHARVANTRAAALRYRQTLVPLRASIVKQTQKHANYMLIGQFEWIRAKQQEYETYRHALESLRDYWLARVELARAVGSRLPSAAQIEPTAPQLPATDAPSIDDTNNAAPAVDHSHH
jgi:outer membrane protein, heavy metal efflux system